MPSRCGLPQSLTHEQTARGDQALILFAMPGKGKVRVQLKTFRLPSLGNV
jgi:hypothetical protein